MVKKKGTDAADLLKGTTSADDLLGLAGTDTIKGFGKGDTISGGDGKDKLFGGDGDDIIYGHSSADLRQSNSLIQSKVVANIGDRPVQVTTAPGDNGSLYGLTEHSGIVYRIDAETGDKTKFLDIPDSDFSVDSERGVLGIAFDPDYATSGRFFVYLTNPDGNIEIREYHHTDGHAKADPDPVQTIMTIPHPDFPNHNGGSMVFGPDGYLYIGTGDGGSGGDPNGNAQNTDSLLGKILRIDINGDDFPGDDGKNYAIPPDNAFVGKSGADEIWALGLRNPWRFSFDTNGDLYIGDVGQDKWEEIDYVKHGTESGLNFGWNFREGLHHYTGTPPNPHDFTDPVFEYSHHGDNAAVTGGVVYHGKGGLDGAYIFNDFVTGKLYTLRMVDGKPVDVTERSDQVHGAALTTISDYGVDKDGNLYAASLDGRIILVTPGKSSGDGADEIHGGAGSDKIYGGAGNDKMFGDDGGDRLDGGIGNDQLTGGTGADTFVFKTGTGRDTIVDFAAGGTGHDVVDLSHFAGISGFADLMAHHVTEKGGNVIIESGDDRIILEGIGKADLHGQDFDFG
jgi:glucose/arabinose dehydrogenase